MRPQQLAELPRTGFPLVSVATNVLSVRTSEDQMTLLDQCAYASGPLSYLVASQLQAILESEKELEQQYDSLLALPSSEASRAWAFEVECLKSRTDRLARMLNALDQNYSVPVTSEKNTEIGA